jgi:hypothetical protein
MHPADRGSLTRESDKRFNRFLIGGEIFLCISALQIKKRDPCARIKGLCMDSCQVCMSAGFYKPPRPSRVIGPMHPSWGSTPPSIGISVSFVNIGLNIFMRFGLQSSQWEFWGRKIDTSKKYVVDHCMQPKKLRHILASNRSFKPSIRRQNRSTHSTCGRYFHFKK